MFQESFSQLGVEFYCPKPYNFEELLGKIHKVASQISDARLFHKVVIFGPDLDALNKMSALLKERSCIVSTVENVIEIGLRCFLNNPHLILLDLHSKEYATTREIIRSLRSYEFFKKSDIIVYSNFVSGDMAVIAGMDSLDDEIHSCLKEGANKYIGRFNQVNFLDQLKEFGI